MRPGLQETGADHEVLRGPALGLEIVVILECRRDRVQILGREFARRIHLGVEALPFERDTDRLVLGEAVAHAYRDRRAMVELGAESRITEKRSVLPLQAQRQRSLAHDARLPACRGRGGWWR